ncbi:stage II sporulation protein D [Clostridium formicaceticum]|uniref:Amidase enhancer n=1 Tax=Clostridium formicaceticum TaxID=1497 RepID=A0AAC9RKF3_9CLOT|nr:stage II sporulation protein D [Clostridium formicaceticum]AOY75590.1 stage II sporulation protein D [Clostridium formicaceticum]ARE85895.1 Amidase enhancer precursor [Clostridium formicaceticum]
MKGIFFACIMFLATTLFLPMFILNSCDMEVPLRKTPIVEEIRESDMKIHVYNHETKEIMELYLEEYITQVVAAEMPGSFELEALKAQAVAARTYAIWRQSIYGEEGHPSHPGASICTSHAHCQEWLSMEELTNRHGRKWKNEYLPKIQEAVFSTAGVIMTYNMQPIEPLYHSTSGGKTENSEDVFASALPYLRSVSSPYEERSPVLVDQKEVSIDAFINSMKSKDRDIQINTNNIASQIKILERNQGGSIKTIQIGNKIFTGSEIRQLFDLRSADFSVDVDRNHITFTTRGYGHGVGMSQWGANGMAEEGKTYKEILKHYYQGVTLSKLTSYQ